MFQILKKLSAGQPCDITGIEDYRHLDAEGGIQWQWSAELQLRELANSDARGAGAPRSERRLFADGKFFTPDGRARFLFDRPRPVGEPVDAEFPLVLLTGRGTSAQWHTNTRTGKSAVLRTLYPANPYVEIHPADAAPLRIESNGPVTVLASRKGL